MRRAYVLIFFWAVFIIPSALLAAPIVPDSFSTTWDTGDSSMIQINLGTCPTAVYWEDLSDEGVNGTTTVCSEDDGTYGDQTITFPAAGQYRVDFSGSFDTINLFDDNNRDKFRSVEQWGNSVWTDLTFAFRGVVDLSLSENSAPNLSSVTSLVGMFGDATNFNSPLNHWDVSNVTDMGDTGEGCGDGMFRNATSFNQPLDTWDVSSVTDMQSMFCGASSFNESLNTWDVSNVTEMSSMFYDATSFNQPLDTWNVSNVQRMNSMFNGASAFNQPLNDWTLTSLVSFGFMFNDATSFNQPLSNWDVSGVRFFSSLFNGATSFNQSLENWAFDDADVLSNIFEDSGIDSENYAATLEWWASLNLMPDGSFNRFEIGSVPTTYCDTAEDARSLLLTNGWTVDDLGPTVCLSDEDGSSSSGGTNRYRDPEKYLKDLQLALRELDGGFRESIAALVETLTTFVTELEARLPFATPDEKKKIQEILESVVAILTTLTAALQFEKS